MADYTKDGDSKGKALYRKLLQNLEKRGITEECFVKELCEVIIEHEDFNPFIKELTAKIGKPPNSNREPKKRINRA